MKNAHLVFLYQPVMSKFLLGTCCKRFHEEIYYHMEQSINYTNCSKSVLENNVGAAINTIIQNTRNPSRAYPEHEGPWFNTCHWTQAKPVSSWSTLGQRERAINSGQILRDPIKQFCKTSSMTVYL